MSMYYASVRSDELYHHGVKGMHWGVRRYQNPDGTLTSAGKKKRRSEVAKSVKSHSEKRDRRAEAARSNSTKSTASNESEKKKGLTKNQKTALKIGAAVAVTGLAVYGGYKISQAVKVDKAKWDKTREIVDQYNELKFFNLGDGALSDANERIARAGHSAEYRNSLGTKLHKLDMKINGERLYRKSQRLMKR